MGDVTESGDVIGGMGPCGHECLSQGVIGQKEDAPGGVRTGEGCDAGEQVVWECGLRFTGWVVR